MARLTRLLALAAGAVLFATGCTPDVTAPRLRAAFQETFAHLVVVQARETGRPYRRVGEFYTYAYCHKGPHHSAQTGAGDNWLCVVHWQKYNGIVLTAEYDVNVNTDGCFNASGPGGIVGGPTLTAKDGRSIINPLTQFYGCFSS